MYTNLQLASRMYVGTVPVIPLTWLLVKVEERVLFSLSFFLFPKKEIEVVRWIYMYSTNVVGAS